MKNNYLKSWTIIIVLSALLAVVFTACKDDEEPYDPGCVFPVPTLTVELEKGSVIQMEDGECILSESDDLWKDVQGVESLKSVIYPYAATFETGPIDLSNSVGKRLKFTGLLAMIDRDTLIIEGERQAVVVCQLRNAEIKLSDGSRAGDSSDQIICDTEYSSENYANLLSLSRSVQNIGDTNPLIRLFVSVLRRTNGSGLNKDVVANTILNNLNHTYASTGIKFVLEGSRYLDIIDDNLYKKAADRTEQEKIYSKYNHFDALDVFVFSEGNNMVSNGILAGRARDIPSTACTIFPLYYTDETVAHEIGHCLGLFHTHHGTSLGERDNTTIPELVNGSNAAYAGDYIVDTPADPNTWKGGFFNDIGLRDLNGETYKPDPYNIMSYSIFQERFTAMQGERMLNFLNTPSTNLKHIIAQRQIPTDHLRAGDTISVKYLQPTDIVLWDISNMIGEERPPRAMRVTSNERYIVTSTEESQFFDLKAKVTTAEGKVIELTGKVTSGAPNPDLGMIQWMAEYEIDEDKEVGRPEEEGRYGTYYEDGLSYCDELNVYGNTTIDLSYLDLACAPIPCTFKWVTSTNRVIEDTRFILSPADCSDGYLEIYVVDKYGQMDESRPFSIPVTVHGRYYAAKVAKGVITFEGRSGNEYLKNSETAPKISKIDIYNKAGKLILSETRQKASVATLSLTPLAKGSYKAVVSDNNSFSQDILFEI